MINPVAGGMTACLILTADVLVGGMDDEDGGLLLVWGVAKGAALAGEAAAPTIMLERWFVLLIIVALVMAPLCMQE
jgi:hypothetical protein